MNNKNFKMENSSQNNLETVLTEQRNELDNLLKQSKIKVSFYEKIYMTLLI